LVRPAFKAAVLQEGIIITIVFIYNNVLLLDDSIYL